MSDIALFSVVGEPVPKERPRVVKGRTYTPAKTLDAEARIAWAFRADVKGWKVDADSRFGVSMAFWNKTKHRRDIDNLVKTVLDGLNGIVWADDYQVHEIVASKHQAPDEPLTVIRIYRLEESF